MFWADRVADEIETRFGKAPKKPLLIRDEKTVSGRVHVGSMRGVAIHGAIAEALSERGVPNTFKWEFNDFDVFDSVPPDLDQERFTPYLGMLLKDVPSPDSSAKNFAEYIANDFWSVMQDSGYVPERYWGSELYQGGNMDEPIRLAIEHADDIRRIYKEVSGSQREETWLPVQVICPKCRKVATTKADSFDGEKVHFECAMNAVEYTQGCGYHGSVSPFGGNAKLLWKVEWPAKWKVIGVDVEGGGKDHSTKGGSRDVANHISKKVFDYEPPVDAPYEFFLVGGKKMSSSKGRGSSAREIADLMPAKIFRLALIGKDINQAFNFDPEGDTLPVLYDQYDKLAENYWAGVKDDFSRLFEFLHPERKMPAQQFLPRFSQVAFIAQMQHLDFYGELEKIKGSPLAEAERAEAQERKEYALRWLEAYAPEKFVFKLQEDVPQEALHLSDLQKKAMGELLAAIEEKVAMPTGEELHHRLHEIKESLQIPPGDLFSAIYLGFLGKTNGPKAGWFLSVLDREFVLKRLRALVG